MAQDFTTMGLRVSSGPGLRRLLHSHAQMIFYHWVTRMIRQRRIRPIFVGSQEPPCTF
ncbi:hypothetical protein HanRHA438_Chr13g0599261 [Helianthus annuus]|nr:hypothetical protein HanIR_Chr13g0640971 [Helianthus annuus]KAJ0858272.1 hypothetical protein HanRHA438_Chr13g0599261 [Helianthus annuus]